MRVRGKKAFTLIEVMIIFAIIAILAAIVIPNLMQARVEAQTNRCISNLKEIKGAISSWALDNKMDDTDSVTMSDLVPTYIRSPHECPLGGDYVLSIVGMAPLCANYDPKGHPAILSID